MERPRLKVDGFAMTISDSEMDENLAWPVEATAPVGATARMNRMYRRQRHIYDGTRRYYLLGRDQLIAGLKPAAGATVLEIGCGTGRNLTVAARQYPGAKFFGIDVSTEMLTSAIASITRHGQEGQIRVAHGDATAFDPQTIFGVPSFDHVMISYSLSMIPHWQSVLERAASSLKHGGCLHIVDFGQQEGLPRMARAVLRRWLAIFDVTPRDNLEGALRRLAGTHAARLRFERPFRGYAQYAVLTFPARPKTA
jgi:S-adenosylmethionine-diacylgycerolhomoserine-N-methlytransferase